jgi:hypothetical protein
MWKGYRVRVKANKLYSVWKNDKTIGCGMIKLYAIGCGGDKTG